MLYNSAVNYRLMAFRTHSSTEITKKISLPVQDSNNHYKRLKVILIIILCSIILYYNIISWFAINPIFDQGNQPTLLLRPTTTSACSTCLSTFLYYIVKIHQINFKFQVKLSSTQRSGVMKNTAFFN